MRIPLREYNKSDAIRKTLNNTSLQMYTNSVLRIFIHWNISGRRGSGWFTLDNIAWSGNRDLPPPCCVLEQDTLLPESTG